jgi:hypothetical protein
VRPQPHGIFAEFGEDGNLQFNETDEIHRETLLTRNGEIVNARVREYLGLPALAAESKGA